MAFIWIDSGKPCIQLPSWELKPGILQLHFKTFTEEAINLHMAVTNLPMRPFIRQSILVIYRYYRKLTSGYLEISEKCRDNFSS
jgi:hypothetical protein